ncbi:DUF952 domain-containing protein [Actinorugispora endophytica]|uniref:Uncharacterized protein (DUF952 family) n=1 Tax=Actinorugispora endophytica TaxID=1605990 RepID=A0A4R6USN7_9ACTN|nr:DUF952 domain-containing protein [Actinorugispora endophytica]TDQ50308.1 uncharacterized protein (DUF952 family) [Actinorugispora endophytica]
MIYHLVPIEKWKSDPERPYTPASLERDGFVHGAADEKMTLRVANAFFRDPPSPVVALVIDEAGLSSEVRDEKAVPTPPGFSEGVTFRHVYGPIERSAVVALLDLECDDQGCYTALVPRG